MIINHNLMAMNAQRQFNINGKYKKKSTEKLSSGYKVNRAADDAAGLSISEKMRNQIRGLNQAAKNIEDGISFLQVADGALNEVHNMLHRMDELSVQAANDINTDSDREAIQQEIDQIVSEIDRIGNDTEFNSRKVFNHSDIRTDETGKKYKVEYEYVTTTYTETVPDTYTYTETIPARYGVSSISAKGQITNPANNKFLLRADENGLRVNSSLYKWDEICTAGGNALSSLGQYLSYSLEYNGSNITITTSSDCTDIKSLINSLDGVEIDYLGETRTVTSPIQSISVDPFVASTPRNWMIDSNDNTTLSITATDDYIYFKSGWRNVGLVSWSRVKYTEGTDTVEAKIDYVIPVTFTLKKTDNYEEDLKAILQSDATPPSIVLHGDYKYGAVSNYAITVNGNTISEMGVYNLEEAFADMGFTGGTLPESKRATSEIYGGVGVHNVFLEFYPNGERMRFYLDDTGAVRLDRNTQAGDYYRYRFYYRNKDKTMSNAYIELPVQYKHSMSATETRADLANYPVSIYYGSEYTAQSTDIGGSSGSLSKEYSIGGLNDAQDEIVTHEEIIGYHDEEKTRVDVVEKRIYLEEGDDDETRELWIQTGANSGEDIKLDIPIINKKELRLNELNVLDEKRASNAIDRIGNAVKMVSAVRSYIGAQQNRLEYTYTNVKNYSENLEKAESSIRDTDMAEEMSELARHNILEQMGISMLTQANQSNQGVLNLLQ